MTGFTELPLSSCHSDWHFVFSPCYQIPRPYEPSWSASERNASNSYSYRQRIQPNSTAVLQF